MTTVPIPPPVTDGELPKFQRKAGAGSAWAALVIALTVKPDSLEGLLHVVGVPHEVPSKYRERAFNAVADAWDIYQDACDQGEG